ncbi:MAG TPA: AAA family ATPase [Baekduia sp.]|nr:AAA family ATPase [Baekduia sp.]
MIRISRLDLERWGHFDDRSIGFAGPGRLHVVYGDNEAGKSTTRRAVSALLFGIPARTVDRRGRSYGDLRVGALLELDGRPTELVRRKGNKDTLLDRDGQPLDEAPLVQALGGLTAEVHAGLFEITHGSLVEGGQELLEGRGAVGESLFAAAAGTSRLHRLLRGLEAEADEIFTPRGTKKELNAALRAHDSAAKAVRELALRPAEHARLAAEVRELDAEAADAGAALADAQHEIERLSRLRGALPAVVRRDALLRERAGLGDVPTLAADAATRREAASERRDAARVSARTAQQAIARVRPRLEGLEVDDALLARADEVLELLSRARVVREDRETRVQVEAALADEEAALQRLLGALAPALGGRSLEQVTLDDAARERLDRCLEARAGVEQRVAGATAALEEAQRRAGADAAALERAPVPADDAGLVAALRAARPAVAGEETAAHVRGEAAEARTCAARAAVDAVGAQAGAADGAALAARLAEIPVPHPDEIERLLRVHAELADAAQRLRGDERRLADEREALAAERAGAAGATPLPEPGALHAARAARAARWREVRAALAAPVDDPDALAEAFEAAVAGADAIADQQLQHADEVARVAALDRRLAEAGVRAEGLARRREEHEAALAGASATWAAAWAGAGTLAPAPEAATAFLAAREAVLAHVARAEDAVRRAEALEADARRHAAALSGALVAAGASVAPGATLAALVEQADAHATALRDRRTAREQLEDAAHRSATARAEAEVEGQRAQADLTAWRTSWEGLRDDCGLDAALSPEDALGALRRLADASARQARVDELRRDADAIERRAEQLDADVAALCEAAAPDLVDVPAAVAVATLHQRVEAARAAAGERQTLSAELAAHGDDLREAEAEIAAAEEALAELRRAAGAADDAQLAAAEARAARAAALHAQVAELEADIAASGGAPLEEVVAAVGELDADAVPARLEALSAERDALRERRDAAREALVRATDRLAAQERSEEAAAAAQAAAGHLATIRTLAERYARARLAQRVLRDAIERYRTEHEGPMLARANELFPALTCERYARLLTELDEHDEWVLVAQAADGTRLRVEELSDGTREQLFLALRLAAIERYVEVAGPMPVIFDDVLLESDDARAAQILAVLGDLAERTQVIVLTHHRHLVALAAAAVGDERLDLVALDTAAAAADEDGTRVEPPPLHEELAGALRGAAESEPAAAEPGPGEQSTLL